MPIEAPTQILLSFGPHSGDPANLEAISTSTKDFFSSDPNVTNIYLSEAINMPESGAQTLKELYASYGSYHDAVVVASFIRNRGKYPTDEQFQTLRASSLLDPDQPFNILQAKMLDQLTRERVFTIDYECYPDSQAKKMDKQREKIEQAWKAYISYLAQSNPTKALLIFAQHTETLFYQDATRESHTAARIAIMAELAATEQRPLRLFARFGGFHALMAGLLERRLQENSGIQIASDVTKVDIYHFQCDWRKKYYENPNFKPSYEFTLKCMLEDIITSYLMHMDISQPEIATRLSKVLTEDTSLEDTQGLLKSMEGRNTDNLHRFIFGITS